MVRIYVYLVKQIKEKSALYNLESKCVRSPKDVHNIIKKCSIT